MGRGWRHDHYGNLNSPQCPKVEASRTIAHSPIPTPTSQAPLTWGIWTIKYTEVHQSTLIRCQLHTWWPGMGNCGEQGSLHPRGKVTSPLTEEDPQSTASIPSHLPLKVHCSPSPKCTVSHHQWRFGSGFVDSERLRGHQGIVKSLALLLKFLNKTLVSEWWGQGRSPGLTQAWERKRQDRGTDRNPSGISRTSPPGGVVNRDTKQGTEKRWDALRKTWLEELVCKQFMEFSLAQGTGPQVSRAQLSTLERRSLVSGSCWIVWWSIRPSSPARFVMAVRTFCSCSTSSSSFCNCRGGVWERALRIPPHPSAPLRLGAYRAHTLQVHFGTPQLLPAVVVVAHAFGEAAEITSDLEDVVH